jgi:hypothetical protein
MPIDRLGDDMRLDAGICRSAGAVPSKFPVVMRPFSIAISLVSGQS